MAAAQWPQQYPQYPQYQQQQQQQQYQQYQQYPQTHQGHQAQQAQQAQQTPYYHQNQQAHQPQQVAQYQQPQAYQQNFPYQAPQQHQQSQQYQQPQAHQSQQGYDGYQQQQQYASQQYPSQSQGDPQYGTYQYTPQQGTSQYGPYQQPYQPQANPTPAAPQACFNCGNHNHWAQDCPEPKRDVPEGALNPQAFQNPLRRPKNSGAFNTKHTFPPLPGQAQASSYGAYAPPQGYPPPHNGHSGYQNQQAYSPATPVSAQSPAQQQYYQQWQQYYQFQQAQQGNEHRQGSPRQQQQYAALASQTPAHPNAYRQPTRASSKISEYILTPHMSQTQYYPTQAPSASTTPVQYSQQMFGKAALFTTTHPNQQSQSSATVKSHSTAPSPQNVQIARYVIEDDNLDSLDVPDRPTSPLPFGNVHRLPVNLVGQPLPANFVVADTLWPIPPPAIQDEGRCKSRYLHESNSEACLQNIKDSKYWKEYKDDTIFVDISDEGEVIPLDEIQDSLMQRWTDPGGSNETRRVSRSQSRSVSGQKDNDALQSTIDEVERSLQAAKALLEKKERRLMANRRHGSSSQQIQSEQPSFVENAANQELETSPPSAALQKPIKPEKDTEEFLASLGVTGAPKPITETHWPSQRSEHGSPDDRYVSSSRRSSKADIYGGEQQQLNVQLNSSQVTPGYQGNGSTPYAQRSVPPPPPPPPPPMPFRQSSFSEGRDGSPFSAGPSSINPYGYGTNGVDPSNGNVNGNGYFSPPTDGQATPPIDMYSEKPVSRKRSYNRAESSSDEEETPKRRQEDDFTPKLKKRQPKVAAAYSRRW